MNIPNALTPYAAPTPKKAVIYIRVSSEEQVENYSLGTQEEHCRREAKHKGYEVVEVFREEGKSAKTIDGRPELLRMIDFLKKNKRVIDALIVYRLDRLSRQTQDYLLLRKKLFDWEITILSANEPTGNSPTEKLLETILASFAQHDNDVRSERTKNGMRARFLSGMVTNHVPFGYLNQNGYALKDPKTFDTIKRAWDLMATGTNSLIEMSKVMSGWGLNYRHQTLQRIFRNKFYMGILTSPKYPEEVKGQHTPMVTEETFYKVQAILDGRNTNKLVAPRKTRDNIDFPLRRIVRCSKCGSNFTGGWSKYHKYAYYFCRKRCVQISVPRKTIQDELIKLLQPLSPTEKGLKFYCSKLLKTYNKQALKLKNKVNNANEEISKLQTLRQVLVEKNLAGIYSDEVFKEQNAIIEARMAASYASQDDEIVTKYDIEKINAFLMEKLSDLGKTYDTSKSLTQIRCLLGTVFLSGFSWSYPGYSDCTISALYQSILDADKGVCTIGEPAEI